MASPPGSINIPRILLHVMRPGDSVIFEAGAHAPQYQQHLVWETTVAVDRGDWFAVTNEVTDGLNIAQLGQYTAPVEEGGDSIDIVLKKLVPLNVLGGTFKIVVLQEPLCPV